MAWIFNGQRWKETPRFHLATSWANGSHLVTVTEQEDGSRRVDHRFVALCGRPLNEWGWIEHTDEPMHATSRYTHHRDADLAISLRRDHAEKIGVLCDRCKAAT